MMLSADTGPAVSQTPAPEGSGQVFGKQEYLSILLLCSLCLVLFFFRLGDRPLWDVDEGMHAATSKDMVLNHDWVTPRMNGENFYDKTPLFNWLAALSFLALGFTEFAARLPAALLGLGTVLVTYALGRRLIGSRAGLLGGVIVATSPEVIILSRSVVHDISLAFFITLALYFFYAAFSSERRRLLNLLLFYAAMGFGVLAKGPIGALLPAMIIGLFLLAKSKLNFLKEMKLGWGLLVFLLVAVPWYVLVSIRNPDYASYFFLKQNLGNFLSKTQARHHRPIYYYVQVLAGGMFPWSFFLPLVVIRPFSQGIKKASDSVLFSLSWFLVIFLFFSAASSKLGTYILPALPAAALLISAIWHELMTAPAPGLRRYAICSIALLPVFFLAGLLFIILLPSLAYLEPIHLVRTKMAQYGINSLQLGGLWLIVMGIPAFGFFSFVRTRYRESFTAFASTLVAGILVFVVAVVPLIDPYRSTKALAKKMDAALPSGERLVFFWTLRDSALFYTDRLATMLNTEQELRQYLAADKLALCVIDRELYERFNLARSSSIVGEEGTKLLISNKPML